jgi:hypothetical protein
VTTAVVTALVACLAFPATAPRLARSLPPAVMVRLLVPTSVLAASCGVFVLGTVTFTGLGQLTQVARFGGWSPGTLRALDPIPQEVAVAAGALLLPLAAWTLWSILRTGRALLSVHRAYEHLRRVDSPIVVVDSDQLDAFTTPGPYARIVVTSALLAALTAEQRRVLLAHEQSHHRHRHTWWALAADLAAAVNPLLRPTAAAIRHGIERWADEDAARATDRRLVATTIAHVALLRARASGRPAPAGAAAATGGQVPRRVQALLRPAPHVRARHLGAVAVLVAAILTTAIAVERTGETLFEQAQHPTTSAAPHVDAVDADGNIIGLIQSP